MLLKFVETRVFWTKLLRMHSSARVPNPPKNKDNKQNYYFLFHDKYLLWPYVNFFANIRFYLISAARRRCTWARSAASRPGTPPWPSWTGRGTGWPSPWPTRRTPGGTSCRSWGSVNAYYASSCCCWWSYCFFFSDVDALCEAAGDRLILRIWRRNIFCGRFMS